MLTLIICLYLFKKVHDERQILLLSGPLVQRILLFTNFIHEEDGSVQVSLIFRLFPTFYLMNTGRFTQNLKHINHAKTGTSRIWKSY